MHCLRIVFLSTTLILFSISGSRAQTTPEQIAAYKITSVDSVRPEPGADVYVISAPYGKPILTAGVLDEISKKQVLSVDLVYTRYRRSDGFDQVALNLTRLKNLRELLPALFNDHKIDWQLIEQTGAADYATGQTYFHGFIIRTRKAEFTAEDRAEEIKTMEKDVAEDAAAKGSVPKKGKFRDRNPLLKYDTDPVRYYDVGPVFSMDPCDLADDAVGHIEYPMEALARNISGKVQVQITVNRSGGVQDIKITEGLGFGCDEAVKKYLKTMPKWTPARNRNGNVNAYVTLNFWFVMDLSKAPEPESPCDLIAILPKGKTADRDSLYAANRTTTVSEIFSRQKNWNQVGVVCDVTGSMGPYMSDLLKWFRQNTSRIKYFTFFNDGDMAPDSRKAVGSTGGIYRTPAVSFETVEAELYKAMRNGWGGDLPENDVEALLDAEKNAPFATRLVWIADNYATPRDLALLSKVTKPVSIIICSARGGVNTDFLNIARRLKASLHTLSTDLPDVYKAKDGERISVDGRQYELINGKFVRIY